MSVFVFVIDPYTLLFILINMFTQMTYALSKMAIKEAVASHCHKFPEAANQFLISR